MKETHGHEAIDYIKESSGSIDESELVDRLKRRFPDAEFYTCSKSGLNHQELVDFLREANKLKIEEGRCLIETGNVCSND